VDQQVQRSTTLIIVSHEILKQSVTETLSLREPGAKRYIEKPQQRARRLALWLDIANSLVEPDRNGIVRLQSWKQQHVWEHMLGSAILVGSDQTEIDKYVLDLPGSFFLPLQKNVRASFDRLVVHADVLRTNDPGMLERFRNLSIKKAGTIHLAWQAEDNDFWGDLGFDHEGMIIDNPMNPRAWFISALRGAELVRFRRCPVCEHVFYAIRSDQGACSKACNGTLRVRRWREIEADLTSRTAAMLREKKGMAEIAGSLGLSHSEAREYITKARKRQG
jgi:predicted nucleic acid-binding Zn ribbon protein